MKEFIIKVQKTNSVTRWYAIRGVGSSITPWKHAASRFSLEEAQQIVNDWSFSDEELTIMEEG